MRSVAGFAMARRGGLRELDMTFQRTTCSRQSRELRAFLLLQRQTFGRRRANRALEAYALKQTTFWSNRESLEAYASKFELWSMSSRPRLWQRHPARRPGQPDAVFPPQLEAIGRVGLDRFPDDAEGLVERARHVLDFHPETLVVLDAHLVRLVAHELVQPPAQQFGIGQRLLVVLGHSVRGQRPIATKSRILRGHANRGHASLRTKASDAYAP